jgi:hypothetical protein
VTIDELYAAVDAAEQDSSAMWRNAKKLLQRLMAFDQQLGSSLGNPLGSAPEAKSRYLQASCGRQHIAIKLCDYRIHISLVAIGSVFDRQEYPLQIEIDKLDPQMADGWYSRRISSKDADEAFEQIRQEILSGIKHGK